MTALRPLALTTAFVFATACADTSSQESATAADSSSSGDEASSQTNGDDSPSTTAQPSTTTDVTTDGPADSSGSSDPTVDPSTSDSGEDSGGPMPLGPSPGCGSQPGSILSGSINAAGIDREYIIQLPDDYDPDYAYPLIFGFHGLGENMDGARWRFQAGEQWNGQAIGIYPQGRYFGSLGATNWEYGESDPDVQLWDALATAASDQLCIDRDRIFVQGFSSGGFFTHALMCYRGDYIRAAAPSGAGMVVTNCGDAVPMWSAHATNDEIVPFHYGEELRDFWLDKAGCGGMTTPIAPTEHCAEYQGCGDDPIVWCTFDQGHWYMEDWKTPATTAFFQRFESLTE